MRNDILKYYIEVPDNLFALLSRYRVVIPGIQRHYVQGANNPKAESVRGENGAFPPTRDDCIHSLSMRERD